MSVTRYQSVSTGLKLLKPVSALVLTCAMVAGCGGGGSSSPSRSVPVPTPIQDEDPDFEAGVFQSANLFKDFCGDPRRNTAEDVFPDMLGSFEEEGYWLRSWSNETYLWYDEIVDVDPALYATSEAGVADYFELLKTTETTPSGNPKDRFHYTRDTAEYEAEREQGVSAGYGASYG